MDPSTVAKVVGYMRAALEQDQLGRFRQVLESSRHECVWVEEDQSHWNHFRLILHTPTQEYVSLGWEKEKLEAALKDYAETATASMYYPIRSVTIALDLETSPEVWGRNARKVAPEVERLQDIWRPSALRVFLSHSSNDKLVAADLVAMFKKRNASLWVAHQRIKVRKKWPAEIKVALASCHAMLYLSSRSSNRSRWCNQELGWALGAGIPIYCVKLDADPPGFLGEDQAIGSTNRKLREEFFDTFAADASLSYAVAESQVERLCDLVTKSIEPVGIPPTWSLTLETIGRCVTVSQASLDRLAKLLQHERVINRFFFRNELAKVLAARGVVVTEADSATSEDEYDPFADE